jgi:hypothetical protein
MYNDFVEVRIIVLELLESLLFVDLKNLFLDPHCSSVIFSLLLFDVIIDHIFQRRLVSDLLNLRQFSHNRVL